MGTREWENVPFGKHGCCMHGPVYDSDPAVWLVTTESLGVSPPLGGSTILSLGSGSALKFPSGDTLRRARILCVRVKVSHTRALSIPLIAMTAIQA